MIIFGRDSVNKIFKITIVGLKQKVGKYCIAIKKKERYRRFEILCNRLSQSQANKPKAKKIQMATNKLGKRRCSNHVDSAVKNIVSTSESKTNTRSQSSKTNRKE